MSAVQRTLLRRLLDRLSRAFRLPEGVLLLANQHDESENQRAHYQGGVEQEVEDGARFARVLRQRGVDAARLSARSISIGFPRQSEPQRSPQQNIRPKYDPRWLTNRHRAAGASAVPAYGWP